MISVILAFFFGYGLTMRPLLASGLATGAVLKLAFASDTVSIAIMEVVDNALMLVIPGAMDAGLGSGLFRGSLVLSLLVAGAAAFPVNRWLIARGKGHAVVHRYHGHRRKGGKAVRRQTVTPLLDQRESPMSSTLNPEIHVAAWHSTFF